MRKENKERVKGKVLKNGLTILDRTKPFDGKCEQCGNEEDLRPYGKDGRWICYDCGMKDLKTTTKRALHVMFGVSLEN